MNHESFLEQNHDYSKKKKKGKNLSIFQSDFFWNCMNVLIVVVVFSVFFIGMKHMNSSNVNSSKDTLSEFRQPVRKIQDQIVEESLICSIHDQKYHFSIQYNDLTGVIVPESASDDLSNIIDVSHYQDVYELFSAVHESVLNQGGTCD